MEQDHPWREVGRLLEQAVAARERDGTPCRDRRHEEQRLLALAAAAEDRARRLLVVKRARGPGG